jgi:hypothetical protein
VKLGLSCCFLMVDIPDIPMNHGKHHYKVGCTIPKACFHSQILLLFLAPAEFRQLVLSQSAFSNLNHQEMFPGRTKCTVARRKESTWQGSSSEEDLGGAMCGVSMIRFLGIIWGLKNAGYPWFPLSNATLRLWGILIFGAPKMHMVVNYLSPMHIFVKRLVVNSFNPINLLIVSYIPKQSSLHHHVNSIRKSLWSPHDIHRSQANLGFQSGVWWNIRFQSGVWWNIRNSEDFKKPQAWLKTYCLWFL